MKHALNKQIGARIRAKREYLGMTRESLCDYIDISPQFLSEIERGIKGMSAETLCKLCEGLGVSADFVLMGKETLTDVSEISKTFSTLDEKYISVAEELLKTLFKAIVLKHNMGDKNENI